MASIISAGTTSATALNMSADTTGILQLASNNGTVGLTMDTSQNVGIGTSSPTVNAASVTQKLSVNTGGTDKSGISIQHGLTAAGSYVGVGAQFSNNNTGSASEVRFVNPVLNGSSSAIAFATHDGSTLAERARIDSSGNLLVGKTSTSTSAVGVVIAGSGSADYGQIDIARPPNAGMLRIINSSSGSVVGTISQNGTNTTYSTSSDYRLKEAITPMTGALAKVALLKPVTYKWKIDGSDGQGFIAHELAEVEAGCVTGEKDAVQTVEIKDADGNVTGTEERPVYQGIDTSFLVATLTAAIQELNAKVTALENK